MKEINQIVVIGTGQTGVVQVTPEVTQWAEEAGKGPDMRIAVCGYDYREAGVKAVHFPTKIEIFKTDSSGVLQHRLIKIDY